MLSGWNKTVFFYVCTLFGCVMIAAPQISLAQTNNQTPANSAASQNRQNRTGQTYPKLTPQQQAAQQQAAEQAWRAQAARESATGQQFIPGVVNQNRIPTQPRSDMMPAGFPVSAENAKITEDVLDYWETSSRQVKKYRCKFRRWEYDSGIVGYRDPTSNTLAAHRVADGEIRFAFPDRARFETTQIFAFKSPPKKPGDQPAYGKEENENQSGVLERWICTGDAVYQFDFAQRRMYETRIPKEMQGNVANSPLPLIFGANKKLILERYWVRSVPTNGVKGEYWLEIFPKRIEDTRFYSKIDIVIAKEDFLPKAMRMYSPQYNPAKGNVESRYFVFEDREVNGQLSKFSDWLGAFIKPSVPRVLFGKKWVKESKTMYQSQAAVPASMRPQPGQPTVQRK